MRSASKTCACSCSFFRYPRLRKHQSFKIERASLRDLNDDPVPFASGAGAALPAPLGAAEAMGPSSSADAR